jgi:hypothetical protein
VKRLRWLLFATLAACASTTQKPHDNVTIVWNRVDDPHATCTRLDGNRKEVFAIRGCSKWSDSSNGSRTCSIYAREPKNETDIQAFATLGHELMHCMEGNWHDRWGRMTPRERQAAIGSSAASASASAHD